MPKAHGRTDLQYRIIKASRTYFSRASYACVVTQGTGYPDERAIYHIEIFYGSDGRKVRGEASRYGGEIARGARRVAGYRQEYLPANFPGGGGLPKRMADIAVR